MIATRGSSSPEESPVLADTLEMEAETEHVVVHTAVVVDVVVSTRQVCVPSC